MHMTIDDTVRTVAAYSIQVYTCESVIYESGRNSTFWVWGSRRPHPVRALSLFVQSIYSLEAMHPLTGYCIIVLKAMQSTRCLASTTYIVISHKSYTSAFSCYVSMHAQSEPISVI